MTASVDGSAPQSDRPKSLVPAVSSAVRIINYIMAVGDGAGVSEVATALSINKSTCFNILNTLTSFQVLSKDTRHAVYRLGPLLVEWGAGSRRQFSGRAVILDRVNALVNDVDVTCIVGQVLADDRGIVVVDRVVPHRDKVATQAIGRVIPLSGPAMGRLALAYREESEALETARRLGMVAQGRDEDLLQALAQIRRRGYATSVGEYSPDTNAVAAAVIRGNSQVTAILCVIGYAADLPAQDLPRLGERLVRLTRELSGQDLVF
ncbi:IclR family transcriptional regulator [Pseudonocardia sp. GCM10023141]|uniref:IclR family transcriptional regulator n=1 Tax=Pseudonocardia sp. GCM10023141 TaxID=3252653 RepID=UPI00360CF5FE